MKLAMPASERSTCPRMDCGCVLVKDRDVIAAGYGGSIPGNAHCEDVGCLVADNHCVRANHTEINAPAQAAKGISHVLDSYTSAIKTRDKL